MKIAILKERRANETRVAGSPETVKKCVALGVDVCVEKGAGTTASMSDAAFREAGATIADDGASALDLADLVLKVQRPMIEGEKLNELASE